MLVACRLMLPHGSNEMNSADTNMVPLTNVTHIAHVINRLAVGGMENGVVNLINTLPPERFRHSVVCVKNATDFRDRIQGEDVAMYELKKAEGKDPGVYPRFWRLMRQIRPDIVHTRNLGTLDFAPVAALAGVPIRIHGEHGWEASDIRGSNPRYRRLRKVCDPFIRSYVSVSRDIATWLCDDIGIPIGKIRQIYNGVDLSRFKAGGVGTQLPFSQEGNAFTFGFVGRMDPVKGLDVLVEAFAQLAKRSAAQNRQVRLVMIGDGPERVRCESALRTHGILDQVWLPGAQDDIPAVMRALDAFILPSLNEGISNTILEAMSSSLPIIATDVGGNPELIDSGSHGVLVPPGNAEILAREMENFLDDPAHAQALGAAARRRIESEFSLEAMANAYRDMYQEVIGSYRGRAKMRAA